jgi:hypothetical protein
MNVTRTVEEIQLIHFVRGEQIAHVVPDSLLSVVLVYNSISDTHNNHSLVLFDAGKFCVWCFHK